MQILPSIDNTRAKAGLATLGGLNPQDYRRQANAFSSYFDACVSDTADSPGQSSQAAAGRQKKSSASAANTATLATAGLLSAGTGNVVSDPNNVRMTKEDFAQLKASLSKSGISDKDIEELETRVGSPKGLTWGAFMNYLQDKIVGSQPIGQMSVENKRQVQSFLGKIGFTPGESAGLLADLEQGKAAQAWSSIAAQISSLSAETSLSVTPSEAKALAQALGLSASAQTRLSELFSGLSGGEADGQDIKTALLAIAAEVKDQVVSEVKALAEVKTLASQVFVAAQKREFGQTLADSREDQVARKAMLAREMASRGSDQGGDDVSAATRSVADLDFASTKGAAGLSRPGKGNVQTMVGDQDSTHKRVILSGGGQMDEAQADLQGRAGVTGTRADVFSGNGNASGRQDAATDERNAKQRARSGREGTEAAEAGRQKGADSVDAGWTGFWSKIGLEVGESKSTGTGELLKAAMVGVSTPTVSSRMVQAETARGAESYVSSDVLRQVENGMLKNLGQGGHRITLNLTPDELGSVTVMLTIKDKDVQAVIRAETPEAARIISEQAARVRENLEQQGLKVTKLDVQTGLAQQQDQSAWQGAGQHNEARRQQEELDMRRTALRILGMGSGAASNADASRDNPVQVARNEGVDVFA